MASASIHGAMTFVFGDVEHLVAKPDSWETAIDMACDLFALEPREIALTVSSDQPGRIKFVQPSAWPLIASSATIFVLSQSHRHEGSPYLDDGTVLSTGGDSTGYFSQGTMSADAISAVWHQHQIIEQHPRQYSSLLSIRGLTQERTSPLHRRFLSFDETTSPAEAALFDNGRRASTPGSSTAPPSASVMYDSPLYESFTRHDRLGSDASVVSLPPTPYESPLFGTPNQSRRSSLEASFLTEVDVCKPSGSCLLQPTASEDAEEDDSPTPTVLADNDRFESAFDERLESPSDSGTRQVLGTSTATNQVLSRPTSPEDEGSRRLRRAKTIASLSGDRKSSIKVNTAVPPVPAGMRVGSPRPTDCAFIPLHRI